jgi:glycosyltransferase involved in cell wall biosynthesis
MGVDNEPLVSVVIPTYARPDLLSRAIQSVVDQTYENIELVVVDDCSPDSLREIVVDSTPSYIQFSFLRHDHNQGHAAARNTGMEAAEGEFIAFLDDDDEWLEEKIEKQVERFQEASESVGVVYTGPKQLNEDGTVNAVTTPAHTGDVTRQLLVDDFIGTGSMYMIRSDAYESVGGFDDRFPAWVDWDYSLRLSLEYEFAAVTEPLVNRYVGGHDQSSDDYEIRKETASQLFLQKHRSVAANYGTMMERKMAANVDFYLAQSAFANGLYGTARGHMIKAILQYPLNPTYFVFLGILSGGKYTFKPIQAAKRRAVRLLQ